MRMENENENEKDNPNRLIELTISHPKILFVNCENENGDAYIRATTFALLLQLITCPADVGSDHARLTERLFQVQIFHNNYAVT